MQTNEFIKEVEALGYLTSRTSDGDVTVTNHSGDEYLFLLNEQYYIDTNFQEFYTLKDNEKQKLFNLAVEYASTPVDKREEEKKYYLKLIGTAGWCDCIAYNEKGNHYFMSPNYEYPGYKTKFTLKQIKEYGLPNFADSDLFELVEVE